jgi:hypothetical protein
MSGSTRVAEGEYKVLSQAGIGSFVPAVYDFRETWTLWRLEDGTFEVSGTRSYRSPADEPVSGLHLSLRNSLSSVTERPTETPHMRFSAWKGRVYGEFKRQNPELDP